MERHVQRLVVTMLLIMLPVLAEGQSSLLSVPTPQWGANPEEIIKLYGPAVASSPRYLLYRPRMIYGACEVRLEFRVGGLSRIVIGFEPGPRVQDAVTRDVTTIMGVRPVLRATPGGTLQVWRNAYSLAEYGPVPPADPRDWITLQITDLRILRN